MVLIPYGQRNTGAYGSQMGVAERLKIYGQQTHGQAAAPMFPTHQHRDAFMLCPLSITCTMKFASTMFPILKYMHCIWKKKAVRVENANQWNWINLRTWCLQIC